MFFRKKKGGVFNSLLGRLKFQKEKKSDMNIFIAFDEY